MTGFIEPTQWQGFLDDFSKRNQLRPTRLEVIGPEVGAQEEEKYLPLIGVSFEPKGSASGSVEITLGGETINDQRYVTHLVEHVERITPLIGTRSPEEGLGIEDQKGGKTLLRFDVLPELTA